MSDIAERLYGGASTPSTPAPAAPTAPAAPVAPEAPPAAAQPNQQTPQQEADPLDRVREIRANDMERRLYSPHKTYGPELNEALAQVPGSSPEQVAAVAAEYREIFADHGMTADEARDVVSTFRADVSANETTKSSWRAQAMDDLTAAYGPHGAAEALALAQQLVARDPRMAHLLAVTGMGDHPRIVARAVELARRERSRGRL